MSKLNELFMAAGLPGDEDETSAQLQQQIKDLMLSVYYSATDTAQRNDLDQDKEFELEVAEL